MSHGISKFQWDILREIFKHRVKTPNEMLVSNGYFVSYEAPLSDIMNSKARERGKIRIIRPGLRGSKYSNREVHEIEYTFHSSFYSEIRNLEKQNMVYLSDADEKNRKYIRLSDIASAMIEFDLYTA